MSDGCGKKACNASPGRQAAGAPGETTETRGGARKTAESAGDLQVSEYAVPGMDCPSEERLIRMALEEVAGVRSLQFDLASRRVRVLHSAPGRAITERLEPLGLGARLIGTSPAGAEEVADADPARMASDAREAATLKLLLAINAIMFAIELTLGWIAQSAGLIADSLDMFADAAVYGVALYAVGKAARLKLRAARFSGWLQMLLALGALFEVIRRFIFGSEPASGLMMGVGLLALIANVTCLLLIYKHREGGVHMKAGMIFSANDVLANLGVIVAGALVTWTGSRYPDLVIGLFIGLVVLNGARRILRLQSPGHDRDPGDLPA